MAKSEKLRGGEGRGLVLGGGGGEKTLSSFENRGKNLWRRERSGKFGFHSRLKEQNISSAKQK